MEIHVNGAINQIATIYIYFKNHCENNWKYAGSCYKQ